MSNESRCCAEKTQRQGIHGSRWPLYNFGPRAEPLSPHTCARLARELFAIEGKEEGGIKRGIFINNVCQYTSAHGFPSTQERCSRARVSPLFAPLAHRGNIDSRRKRREGKRKREIKRELIDLISIFFRVALSPLCFSFTIISSFFKIIFYFYGAVPAEFFISARAQAHVYLRHADPL